MRCNSQCDERKCFLIMLDTNLVRALFFNVHNIYVWRVCNEILHSAICYDLYFFFVSFNRNATHMENWIYMSVRCCDTLQSYFPNSFQKIDGCEHTHFPTTFKIIVYVTLMVSGLDQMIVTWLSETHRTFYSRFARDHIVILEK